MHQLRTLPWSPDKTRRRPAQDRKRKSAKCSFPVPGWFVVPHGIYASPDLLIVCFSSIQAVRAEGAMVKDFHPGCGAVVAADPLQCAQ